LKINVEISRDITCSVLGSGRKVSITRVAHPMTEELLDIFDYALPELVGSVAQQKDLYQKWVKSLALRR
jgi:hypothetical protein